MTLLDFVSAGARDRVNTLDISLVICQKSVNESLNSADITASSLVVTPRALASCMSFWIPAGVCCRTQTQVRLVIHRLRPFSPCRLIISCLKSSSSLSIARSSIEYVPSCNSLKVHIGGSTSNGLCRYPMMFGYLLLSSSESFETFVLVPTPEDR
jgi:hypothetical protein